jgi:3-phenylpropionate/trans-cinnamate dioxygenase ferredoxin subunit
MADVTITVRTNGPYKVQGPINLVDQDGNPIPIKEGTTIVSLCRCGASVTKPFCDGTHSRIGFKGAEEAAQKFDATRPSP